LANENAELYSMLEERGKIIVVLEKKLEEQVRA
jgi:nitrate reductase NapAB chaperone NapD